MSAPAEKDPLYDLKERLRSAARDLEDAAERANDAIADLDDLDPEEVTQPKSSGHLQEAIERFHLDEHDGPMRWCQHPVCRETQS